MNQCSHLFFHSIAEFEMKFCIDSSLESRKKFNTIIIAIITLASFEFMRIPRQNHKLHTKKTEMRSTACNDSICMLKRTDLIERLSIGSPSKRFCQYMVITEWFHKSFLIYITISTLLSVRPYVHSSGVQSSHYIASTHSGATARTSPQIGSSKLLFAKYLKMFPFNYKRLQF